MFKVSLNARARLQARRDYVAVLQPQETYVLTDYHVVHSIPPHACTSRVPLTNFEVYDGQPLGDRSLLIVWLAGLGDTVAFAPALLSLTQRYPESCVDIVSIPVLFEVLAACGFGGQLIPYPCTWAQLQAYDLVLPLEHAAADPRRHQLNCIDYYAAKLHRPAGLAPPKFSIDRTTRDRCRLDPSPLPQIGVQVTSLSPLRSYPPQLMQQLLRLLIRKPCVVHLLGDTGECSIDSAPPLLINHCGSTQGIGELVALISQMDAMICPDSYLMHLAGALGIPTVALFSTIPPQLRSAAYPSVVSIQAEAECAPCLVVEDDRCPLGHPQCIAWESHPTAPGSVIETLEVLISPRTSQAGSR